MYGKSGSSSSQKWSTQNNIVGPWVIHYKKINYVDDFVKRFAYWNRQGNYPFWNNNFTTKTNQKSVMRSYLNAFEGKLI